MEREPASHGRLAVALMGQPQSDADAPAAELSVATDRRDVYGSHHIYPLSHAVRQRGVLRTTEL
jgi:hypothetical protein